MFEQFTVFETPIGWGGIAWGERGVVGVQLPEPEVGRARARLRRRFPRAVEAAGQGPMGAGQVPPPMAQVPPEIGQAIERITALLRGEASDLSSIQLDMQHVLPFERQVYDVARSIPAGETLSYGQVARRLGDPRLAREVGQALARNPFPIVVPCHRVVGAHGGLGGFSARGGVATKQRLLEIERANVAWQLPLDS